MSETYQLPYTGAEIERRLETMANTVTSTSSASVMLKNHDTVVVTSQISSLSVSFENPVNSVDFEAGLIFKAGTSFVINETAPSGYTIKYDAYPAWTEGNIYEISYRNIVIDNYISALWHEVH